MAAGIDVGKVGVSTVAEELGRDVLLKGLGEAAEHGQFFALGPINSAIEAFVGGDCFALSGEVERVGEGGARSVGFREES